LSEVGALLSGLTFADNGNGSASITGTPAFGTGGSYSLSINASNGVSVPATQPFSLTVDQAPFVTTQPTNATAAIGNAVTFSAAASGNPIPTVQWQLSTNGGSTFANIPGATSGTYSLTAAAGDNGDLYREVFSNGIGSAIASNAGKLTISGFYITTSSLPVATSGVAYSVQLEATGGVTPYKWKLIGKLPKGLKLKSNGLLSGTPRARVVKPGTYLFSVEVATKKSKNQPSQTATAMMGLLVV